MISRKRGAIIREPRTEMNLPRLGSLAVTARARADVIVIAEGLDRVVASRGT